MRYFGGKTRIGSQIAAFLKSVRKPGQQYVEPFVGAAGVFTHMEAPKLGCDLHPDLIEMLKGCRDETFKPPDKVTLEDYNSARTQPPSALRGFIGFGCSFAGRWFEGYAREGKRNPDLNLAEVAARQLMKIDLRDAELRCCEYRDIAVEGALIYCDPPYSGTKWFSGLPRFDSAAFWDWVRSQSQINDVYVSEYAAPDDFECVWQRTVNSAVKSTKVKGEIRIEKLFRMRVQ